MNPGRQAQDSESLFKINREIREAVEELADRDIEVVGVLGSSAVDQSSTQTFPLL